MKEKWIYHQKKDNLFVTKAYYKSREYYVGAFRDLETAVRKRDEAFAEITSGRPHKYRSRTNGPIRKVDSELEWYTNYIQYPAHLDQPEYKLRYSVLMGALKDMCLPAETVEYKEASEWFFGKIESVETYSFEEICDLFKLSPTAVRERIVNIDEETKSRIKSAAIN